LSADQRPSPALDRAVDRLGRLLGIEAQVQADEQGEWHDHKQVARQVQRPPEELVDLVEKQAQQVMAATRVPIS
jgi:hypothetical protein